MNGQKEFLPILTIINERLSRQLKPLLSSRFKTLAKSKRNEKQVDFKSWKQSQKDNSFYIVIRLNSLNAPILLHIAPSIVRGIMKAKCGGDCSTKDHSFNIKDITQLELAFCKTLADELINELNEAWGPVKSIEAEYIRSEVDSDFVGIVSDEEEAFLVQYEIKYGENESPIEILYPKSTLTEINELLSSETH